MRNRHPRSASSQSAGRRILIGALLLLVSTASAARADEADSLRRKQLAQQRARAITAELVAGVLDIQIRQLKENGLDERPIYREVVGMRENLDSLVQDEMEEVVRLLVQAQSGEKAVRLQYYQEARGKVREIVVTLMAERRKLRRRLRAAKLTAQTREIIHRQSTLLATTIALPERKINERERLTLDAAEDQGDVAAMYFELVESLTDVATWDGPISEAAAVGVQLLRTAKVDDELKSSGVNIRAGRFEQSQASQENVIKGLRALLELLERAQGRLSRANEEALAAVRDLIERQEELRDETRDADLEKDNVDPLVDEQTKVHKDVSDLAESLEDNAAAQSLLEQAKSSALAAADRLFDQDGDRADDEQTQVIGALAQLETELEETISDDFSDKSAAELADEVKALEKVQKQLDEAAKKQEQVASKEQSQPKQASQGEEEVAKQLEQAAQEEPLPSAVKQRVAEAADQAREAEEALKEAAANAAEKPQAKQEVDETSEKIQRAQAEVAARLADAKRRQKAVELGELARAAEALERAASAMRNVADRSEEAAAAEGLDEEEANTLRDETEQVGKVAEQIAEGVKPVAPRAAEDLAEAKKSSEAAGKQLDDASKKPGETSKPQANQAAQDARKTAEQLENVAADLRKQQGKTALDLADLARKQAAEVADAREAAEDALNDLDSDAPKSKSEALNDALANVQQAQQDQLTAQGRDEAAAAKKLAQQLEDLKSMQQRSDQAADDFRKGKTNTPLQSASAQQDVADKAGEISEDAPQAVADALNEAEKAAAKSAKNELLGERREAEDNRAKANAAIDKAIQAAENQLAEAMKAKPGEANPEAQAQVTQAAQEAANDAAADAKAAETVAKAAESSGEASQALDAGDAKKAESLQAQTAGQLDASEDAIRKAIAENAKQQSDALAKQQPKLEQLADNAARLDPSAAAALQQAANNAAPQDSNAPQDAAMRSQQDAEQNVERAVASLAARQRRIERDQQIAEAIAALAREQQTARETIAEQAGKLADLAQKQQAAAASSPMNPHAAEQRAAAEAMQQAQQTFAEAQRATGQGAAEISNQTEVANQPIREGLETASELQTIDMPLSELADAGQATSAPADVGSPMDPSQAPQGQNAPPMPGGESQAGQPQSPSQPGQTPMTAATPGAESTELGSGLVPQSPDTTAQQIAGAKAAQMQAAALAQDPTAAQDDLNSSDAQSPMSSQQPGDQAAQSDSPSQQPSQQASDKPSDTPADGISDASGTRDEIQLTAQRFREDPWFAKLPPSLRKAIQARTRRAAPKGYEERLRRYFQSVD